MEPETEKQPQGESFFSISRFVSRFKKLILPLVLIYVLSPVDFRPDWIPVIGWIDDLIVLAVGIIILLWLRRGYQRVQRATPPPPKDKRESEEAIEGQYRIIE